ncbi:MAG TPA: RNA polymerase sigma factor [Candidatus Sulfotelmatobacter sp.]|jgi:RNA polymerase sigma-70 factor (ECF subfamily)|nr:RNA polymerase sigma factor [Candidatus Sulfotelmatobacter sp.]
MEAMVERPAARTLEDELEELHPLAFGWALACCRRDRALAEEVLQNAYLRVLAGAARFDGRSSLKTWLFSVIRRTAASERRREWMTGRFLARFAVQRAVPEPPPDPFTPVAASERAQAVARALKHLSGRQREILHLVFYQGMTIEEAADVTGISVGSARVHYERGKARLRLLLPAEAYR